MKKLSERSEDQEKLIEEKEEIDQDQLFIKYFNIVNAKLIAVLLVVLFIVYHGYLNSYYGRNSCNRLFGEGHILGDNEWQPYGCMIHKYNEKDIQTCFKYIKYYNGMNRFYFIGDFRIKQIYTSFVHQIDPSYQVIFSDELSINNCKNLTYENKDLNLEVNFIWKPIIDEAVYNLVESLLHVYNKKPSFLVMGMATNYLLMNGTSANNLDSFKTNLSNLVEMINSYNYENHSELKKLKNTRIRREEEKNTKFDKDVTKLQTESSEENIIKNNDDSSFYWMLQDPIDESKLSFNRTLFDSITNQQIDEYNRAAISILYHSTVKVWSSSRLISQGFNKDSHDGLHIGKYALNIDSQILFNSYCNDRLNFADASCCSQPESVSISQQILFIIFLINFVIAILLCIYKKYCSNHSNKFRFNLSGSEISFTSASCKNATSSVGIYTTLSACSKLFLIIVYFYLCDRANYFMKENQHFTLLTFLIPLIYVSVVGVFFNENLNTPKLMNRRQTDEIKGYMVCIVLIYKITTAQISLPLYYLVRLISSSYLFFSGYGHFMYYWNTANYNIPRLFQVLFRLNFLTVILCFSMNRMYQFYNFIPLVSFWFICSYIVMSVYPRVSLRSTKESPYQFFYIFIKLCILLGCVITLNASQTIFERTFMVKLWKYLFVNSDDLISEWRSRWMLDGYSFVLGMFFALFLCILKRLNIVDIGDDSQIDFEERITELREKKRDKSLPKHIKFFLAIASLIGLISYTVFANLCKSKEGCNLYIPYITIIPILSFIVLRSVVTILSEKYSYMFSWIGKISLELFVCSYHIWLSADSNGVLVLMPGFPVLNMLITTFIFIYIAHELNSITRLLSQYFVPNNWRICLRNFFLFLIILLPMAIRYGYV